MNLLEKTTEPRQVLAQSATFAMSLGAKELFHTNFLAFLLESQDAELKELQTRLRAALGLPVIPGEKAACAVWRERHNLDLIVVPLLDGDEEGEQEDANFSRCLVIEAKLKSVPTRKQLQDYLTKKMSLPYPTPESKAKSVKVDAEVVRRVLLTPEGVTLHSEWPGVAWQTIADAVSASLKGMTGSTLRAILEDYATALGHVLRIVQGARQHVGESLASRSYTEFYDELVHPNFRDLRLHDLTGKVAFDEWVTMLHEDLTAKLSEEEHLGKPVRLASPFVHFSRSEPGLDLETNFGEFQIGVQVQGKQFRRYVASKDPRRTLEEEVLSDESLMNIWLQGHCPLGQLLGVDGKPIERMDRQRSSGKGSRKALSTLKAFNADKFIYSSVALSPEVSMTQVHQAVIDSMLLACSPDELRAPAP